MALMITQDIICARILPSPQSRKPRLQSKSIPSTPLHIKPYLNLSSRNPRRIIPSATASPPPPVKSPEFPTQSRLIDSTRTVTTLVTLAVTILTKITQKLFPSILNPNLQSLETIRHSLQTTVVGPAFFASTRDRSSVYLNTPLTVVAAGLSKWLDIYSGVLMVRVLLSWFPNIPWDRQPLSAIRDLCDPYLNLFRNIIPPVFDTLDVSPLMAFAVLGVLGSILHGSLGG